MASHGKNGPNWIDNEVYNNGLSFAYQGKWSTQWERNPETKMVEVQFSISLTKFSGVNVLELRTSAFRKLVNWIEKNGLDMQICKTVCGEFQFATHQYQIEVCR